jgi:hypothetical protein
VAALLEQSSRGEEVVLGLATGSGVGMPVVRATPREAGAAGEPREPGAAGEAASSAALPESSGGGDPAATEYPLLPPGWSHRLSSKGKVMFFNVETQEAVNKLEKVPGYPHTPGAAAAAAPSAAPAAAVAAAPAAAAAAAPAAAAPEAAVPEAAASPLPSALDSCSTAIGLSAGVASAGGVAAAAGGVETMPARELRRDEPAAGAGA